MTPTATVTRLFTAVEASEQLPYKPRTLIDLARAGRIGCVRLSERKIRFRQEDIDEFIKASAKPLPAPKPSRALKYSR